MTPARKVIVNRMIERNLEQYDGFFDHAWATEFTDGIHPHLSDAANNLCLVWKEASNTHRLPWLMVHQMKSFAEGFMSGHKSQTAKVVEQFQAWVKGVAGAQAAAHVVRRGTSARRPRSEGSAHRVAALSN